MANSVIWLIGRGASVACNLTWIVPDSWKDLSREDKIAKIKQTVFDEMNKSSIDTTPYKMLLGALSSKTNPSWRHLFITPNWDYLLQREIQNLKLKVVPTWLANSHVFHVNGTVEILEDNLNRSPFLLEEDPPQMRITTLEASTAFEQMIWSRLFIVVGMSFECQMDRFLLTALNKVEDDLPIGESKWLIVNPDATTLAQTANRIQKALPRSTILTISKEFDVWVKDKMPQLQTEGILST